MAISSGILAYRFFGGQIEFLLVKPGGPFYKNSDKGIWTIPKGEVQRDESEIDAAKREFKEETGFIVTSSMEFIGKFRLRKGKNIVAYITEEDFDLSTLKSNNFEMEYPKGSGEIQNFPEVETGEWMTLEIAQSKIFPSQLPLLESAVEKIIQKQ